MSFWHAHAWVITLVSASFCLTAAIQLWRYRETWSVKSLIILMLSLMVWALGYGLFLRLPGLGAKLLWAKVGLTGVAAVPAALAMLALSHSPWDKLLNRKTLPWFFVPPLLAAALTWTTPLHQLILETPANAASLALRPVFGLGFWIMYIAYPFLVIGASLLVLLRAAISGPGPVRREIIFILAGFAVPAAGVVLYHTTLHPLAAPDPTSALFFFAALLAIFAVFRYRTPQAEPIEVAGGFLELRFQVHVLRSLVVVLIPTLAYFIAHNFDAGWYFAGAMNVLFLVTVVLFAVLIVNTTSPALTKRLLKVGVIVFVALFWVLAIHFLTYELGTGTILWSLAIPLVCLLAFGPRTGLILSLVFQAVSMAATYLLGNIDTVYFSKFGIRYIVVYLILAISLFYIDQKRLEFLGQTTRQRDDLLEAQKRYRWATESGGVGVWSLDAAQERLTVDDNIPRILGYGPEPPFYRLADLLALCPAADRPQARENWRALCAKGEPSDAFEMPLRDRWGGVRWFLIRGRQVEGLDQADALILGTITDITERRRADEALRRSEARYRAMAKNFPDGALFLLDQQGRFLFADGADFRALGLKPRDLEGKEVAEVFSEQVAAIVEPMHWKVLDGETVTYEVDYRGRTYENLAVPVRDERGLVTQGLVICRNVTQKHEMEARLRQALKMEAIGTLAGGVAHDFNNILAIIMGYGELALSEAKKGRLNLPALREILESGERASDLVRRIMTFSRRTDYQIGPLDANEAALSIGRLLQQTLPKMIEIRLKLGQNLPLAQGDRHQVEQILMNLCTNARDAMPRGGTLTISTDSSRVEGQGCLVWSQQFSGDYLVLGVADTGMGMDAGQLKRIFDPFYTTKEVGKGTGLGLSTVFGMVKSLNGHLTCHSRPGRGTDFKLYLPLSQQTMVPAPEETAQPVEGRGETILMVDDEQSLVEITSHQLESSGYQMLTAGSGEQALVIYQEKGPQIDLVTLDLSMPGIGGRQCLQGLMAMDPAVKVIIATGYGRDVDLDEVMASGPAALLVKPFKQSDLLRTIRSVLDA